MILLDVFCNITVTFLSGYPLCFPFLWFLTSHKSFLWMVFVIRLFREHTTIFGYELFRKFHKIPWKNLWWTHFSIVIHWRPTTWGQLLPFTSRIQFSRKTLIGGYCSFETVKPWEMISLNQALNKSQGRFNVKYINASSLMQQVCTL